MQYRFLILCAKSAKRDGSTRYSQVWLKVCWQQIYFEMQVNRPKSSGGNMRNLNEELKNLQEQ